MKANINEYDGCFELSLDAETVEDAAKIARLALNKTKKLRSCYASFYKDGTASGAIFIGRKKMLSSIIGS